MTDTAATKGPRLTRVLKGLGDALKHPLVLLLIGTTLGSFLIPHLNDRSTQKTARQEQRVKMAISIIEQDHETNKEISGMMNYLLLVRQNLQVAGLTSSVVEKEEYTARQKMDDMYLAFNNGQAWWWYSDIQADARLSALATSEESRKIAPLASQYGTDLNDETQALSQLWSAFLKSDFKPSDAKYDELQKQIQQREADDNNLRNNIAIQMAIILASDSEK